MTNAHPAAPTTVGASAVRPAAIALDEVRRQVTAMVVRYLDGADTGAGARARAGDRAPTPDGQDRRSSNRSVEK
jgi:hypothetical protein